MEPDDLVCYCFRVSLRKLRHFARRERPARASQMSECLGAGTGCGWCIPYLERLWGDPEAAIGDAPEAYAAARGEYHGELVRGRARHAFGRALDGEKS